MKRQRNGAQAGFGLVETLIAAVIIATVMGMFFQVVAGHARSVTATVDRRAAALVAASALDAALGDSEGIVPKRGADARLWWQVTIAPHEPRAGAAPPLDLVTVTVARIGSDHPLLQLRSLRIGR